MRKTVRGLSKVTYEAIRDSEYSPHASWAMWRFAISNEKAKAYMGDMSIFEKEDNELFRTLHTDIVFVALNSADRDIAPVPFSAFHDSSPRAMDYKMRYAFKDTILWGSYLTDFFHGLRETDSGKVKQFLAKNPEYLAKSITRFKEELEFVTQDEKPILIALGSQVKELLDMYAPRGYTILALPHYSYSVMTKELYRAKALEVIAEIERVAR